MIPESFTGEPQAAPFEVQLTRPGDSLAWIRTDLALRLVPFMLVCSAVAAIWRPAWMGVALGRVGVQLAFAAAMCPLMFVTGSAVQLALSRRRRALRVPAGPGDAALQAVYYVANAALEEAFFRGLVQGGLAAVLTPAAGFAAGTSAYVLYHRLGGWSWADVAATALVGVPLGLAFWLLPGPPSLLGVAIAHAGATWGFLGPGPWLLHRLRLLPA